MFLIFSFCPFLDDTNWQPSLSEKSAPRVSPISSCLSNSVYQKKSVSPSSSLDNLSILEKERSNCSSEKYDRRYLWIISMKYTLIWLYEIVYTNLNFILFGYHSLKLVRRSIMRIAHQANGDLSFQSMKMFLRHVKRSINLKIHLYHHPTEIQLGVIQSKIKNLINLRKMLWYSISQTRSLILINSGKRQ